jgi:hypothetical protein
MKNNLQRYEEKVEWGEESEWWEEGGSYGGLASDL